LGSKGSPSKTEDLLLSPPPSSEDSPSGTTADSSKSLVVLYFTLLDGLVVGLLAMMFMLLATPLMPVGSQLRGLGQFCDSAMPPRDPTPGYNVSVATSS
jgi:hypothetical protein